MGCKYLCSRRLSTRLMRPRDNHIPEISGLVCRLVLPFLASKRGELILATFAPSQVWPDPSLTYFPRPDLERDPKFLVSMVSRLHVRRSCLAEDLPARHPLPPRGASKWGLAFPYRHGPELSAPEIRSRCQHRNH